MSDGPGARLLRPLRGRDFRLLWLGESVSVVGNHFYSLALAWVVLDVLGAGGLVLGTVTMAAAVPLALFMLFGGVLSDRVHPRRIMLVSNAGRGVLVAGLAAIVFAQLQGGSVLQVWHLYLFSVVFGTIGAFFLPAMMSMVPILLERDRLEAGNALLMGTMELGSLVGPALAGVVVAAAGTAVAFSVDAATFIFAAATLGLMTAGRRTAALAPPGGGVAAGPPRRSGALADLVSGFRYSWGHRGIRVLLPVLAIVNLSVAGPFGVGLPVLVHDLTGQATSLGIIMGVAGGGGVVGTLLAGSLRLRHRGWLLIGALVSGGSCLGLLGLAPSVAVIALLVGLASVVNGLANVGLMAYFQRTARPDMLGRLMSLTMFASAGLQPFSLVLAGYLSDFSPGLMFGGAGGLIVLAGLGLALSRVVRGMD